MNGDLILSSQIVASLVRSTPNHTFASASDFNLFAAPIGIHFPFVALIDCKGYRILAQTRIPISPETLIYGSPDGGKTIVSRNADLLRKVKRIAQTLNLASHYVWDEDMRASVKMYTPVDCEGHLGHDARLYLLDPARCASIYPTKHCKN